MRGVRVRAAFIASGVTVGRQEDVCDCGDGVKSLSQKAIISSACNTAPIFDGDTARIHAFFTLLSTL